MEAWESLAAASEARLASDVVLGPCAALAPQRSGACIVSETTQTKASGPLVMSGERWELR